MVFSYYYEVKSLILGYFLVKNLWFFEESKSLGLLYFKAPILLLTVYTLFLTL